MTQTQTQARALPGHGERFLDHLRVERGLSTHSLAAYTRDLRCYGRYLDEVGIASSSEVTGPDLAAFVGWLREQRSERGEPYADATMARTLVAVRGLHRFLVREGLAGLDPSQEVTGPRAPRGLPHALSRPQVQALLQATHDGQGPFGLRDRAMLELLYGSGLRISELVELDVDDVDLQERSVRAFGKGSRERIVPLGRPAATAVATWVRDGRPQLRPSVAAVCVNARGGRLSRQGAWKVVKRLASRAGLGEAVSPHTLRHTFATHLLDGGADVRVVQELLGHASVATTQIYTHVSTARLRAVFEQAHPRARLTDLTSG